jgi:ribonuclease D
MNNLPTQPIWIDQQAAFDQLCQQLMSSKVVALDTEFIRRTTYFPILALLQIASPVLPGQYLIDPTGIHDWQYFTALLENADVCKVLHAGQEDLEILQRLTGVRIVNLFDTQLAHCCVGGALQIGYSKLVQHFFAVELNNQYTCSDWLQRPLSAGQCDYAAKDVQYLPAMYELLMQSLQDKQRLLWLQEEVQHLQQQISDLLTKTTQKDSQAYFKIHEHWLLTPAQLYTLQQLTIWREYNAQQDNVPKRYIAEDEQLMALAQLPSPFTSLRSHLNNRYLRAQHDPLLALLVNCHGNPLAMPAQPPLPKEFQPLLKKLKMQVQKVAQQYAITPDFLCGKKLITQLIRYQNYQPIPQNQWPSVLLGWRYKVVIESLIMQNETHD